MTLKEGVYKSLEVAELQARLNSISFSTGLVNGEFDTQTDKAVKDFQKANSLTVDGIVGPNTNKVLQAQTKGELLFLFLHCSASPAGLDFDGEWIRKYHMERKGWSRPGYSDVIRLDGTLDNIYPWNTDDKIDSDEHTWGTRKLNKCSRHICYIGGVSADSEHDAVDTRTKEQRRTMKIYIDFHIAMYPDLIIVGHNQVQRKACPSFDVPDYLRSINISAKNIAHWGRLYK